MALTLTRTRRHRWAVVLDALGRLRRHVWIVVGSLILGGAVAALLSGGEAPRYESSAVLLYQSHVGLGLPGDGTAPSRDILGRYRELVLARSSLAQILQDPALDPYPDLVREEGLQAAIDRLHDAVRFEERGDYVFRITYADTEPARARAVTTQLAELVVAKEAALRQEQRRATVEFAERQHGRATEELRRREAARTAFDAAHPPRPAAATATASAQRLAIASIRSHDADGRVADPASVASAVAAADLDTARVEDERAHLQRAVADQEARLESLAAVVHRAKVQATLPPDELEGSLIVIDPAFTPAEPIASERHVLGIAIAGIALLTALGCSLALGFALAHARLAAPRPRSLA